MYTPTPKDYEKLIRIWNSTFHTQYRYGNDDTNRKLAKFIEAAGDMATAVSTFCNATEKYNRFKQNDPYYTLPGLALVISLVTSDQKDAGPYRVCNYFDYDDPSASIAVGAWAKYWRGKPLNSGTSAPSTSPVIEPATISNDPIERKEEKNMAKDQGLELLAEVMANTMKSISIPEIEKGLTENLAQKIDKYIADNYGPITRKTVVSINNQVKQVQGVVHKEFGTVLSFVASKEPVFLTGPAGTGKNHLVKQVAEALGIDFHYTNNVTQEYQIKGFTDANGKYQETEFYRAFKNGGVFMLDEMDASNPEVLTMLNGAIANGYFDFPAPIGKVDVNPNFICIAAGNTTGHGANYDYVGRLQLDAATLDRFGLVKIDYDPNIENSIGMNDSELIGFCRAYRKACEHAGVKSIVSYRAIGRMAKLKDSLEPKKLLETCLFKGLERSDLQMIKNECQGFGVYSDALNRCC